MVPEVCPGHHFEARLLLALHPARIFAHLNAIAHLVDIIGTELAQDQIIYVVFFIIEHTRRGMVSQKVVLAEIYLPEGIRRR